MRLYLDDNIASPRLTQLLRKSGHDVELPADAGTAGAEDGIHLTRAIKEERVCLTQNYGDFEILHNLIAQAKGHHPGIMVVRRENDPTRDLSMRAIVRAVDNVAASGIDCEDQYIILNQWR